nr:40S ribosomal protein S3-3 isoform X2 [Ipomoea trifida]
MISLIPIEEYRNSRNAFDLQSLPEQLAYFCSCGNIPRVFIRFYHPQSQALLLRAGSCCNRCSWCVDYLSIHILVRKLHPQDIRILSEFVVFVLPIWLRRRENSTAQGLAACYSVLRFVRESGAKGFEGVLDIKVKVKIMLDWDPKGKHGLTTPLPADRIEEDALELLVKLTKVRLGEDGRNNQELENRGLKELKLSQDSPPYKIRTYLTNPYQCNNVQTYYLESERIFQKTGLARSRGYRGRGGRGGTPNRAAAEPKQTVVRGSTRGKTISTMVVYHNEGSLNHPITDGLASVFKEAPLDIDRNSTMRTDQLNEAMDEDQYLVG